MLLLVVKPRSYEALEEARLHVYYPQSQETLDVTVSNRLYSPAVPLVGGQLRQFIVFIAQRRHSIVVSENILDVIHSAIAKNHIQFLAVLHEYHPILLQHAMRRFYVAQLVAVQSVSPEIQLLRKGLKTTLQQPINRICVY